MTIARRPIASIEQVDGLQTALDERNIVVDDAGAGAATDGHLVTVGDHAYINREDIGTSIVLGGATNYENVIGGNIANVNTATSNLTGAPMLTDANGNWIAILGGYDNVVNGWANFVGGFHQSVGVGANHNTILGGSICSIADEVEYSVIIGGNQHSVSGDAATICGGLANTVGTGGGTIVGGGNNTASDGGSIGGGGSNTSTGGKSAVGGGYLNQATGVAAAIAGGDQNKATANYSTVAGGSKNEATAAQAAVGGGDNNKATGQGAAIAGGGGNTASGTFSAIPGGYGNTAGDYVTAIGRQASSLKRGSFVHGAGAFSAAGDAQAEALMLRVQTTNATPTLLALLGYANYYMTVPANTTWAVEAYVVARRVDAGGEASAAYKWQGVIKRDTNATSIVGTPTLTVLAEEDASWDVAFTANDTNERLDITVTGAAGQTINWVARVQTVEVTG